MLTKKADILYLIMGTNPFPNLISTVTRLKEGGEIYCICTKETKNKPFNRFKDVLRRKGININTAPIEVKDTDREDIEDKIIKHLSGVVLKASNDILIELNYNGGTKVMSAVSYDIIKNFNYEKYDKNIQVNLTYIDPEKDVMYLEQGKGPRYNYVSNCFFLSELDSNISLELINVIDAHNDISGMKFNSTEIKPEIEELAKRLGNLFVDVKYEDYKKAINFLEMVYDKACSSRKTFLSELNNLFLQFKMPINLDDIITKAFNKDKEIVEYFKGKWLEKYIISIINELKQENVIEDTLANVEESNTEGKSGFEVDIVMYKKYKLYAVSVTSIEKTEEAAKKLYEVSQRAKNLAGDEGHSCFINLCWETEVLINQYRNIWDNYNPKNTLILGAQDFGNIKDKLKSWILGGN